MSFHVAEQFELPIPVVEAPAMGDKGMIASPMSKTCHHQSAPGSMVPACHKKNLNGWVLVPAENAGEFMECISCLEIKIKRARGPR